MALSTNIQHIVRNFSLSCGLRQAIFCQDKQLFGNFSLFHVTQFVKASSGQASFSGKFRILIQHTSVFKVKVTFIYTRTTNFKTLLDVTSVKFDLPFSSPSLFVSEHF